MAIDKSGNRVTLKELMETRITALEKATELAAKILEHRLEGMNEFREQLNKMTGTLVTRKELDLILERIEKDKRADISIWLSIIAAIISIVNFVGKF